jgi:carboxypeptidase T
MNTQLKKIQRIKKNVFGLRNLALAFILLAQTQLCIAQTKYRLVSVNTKIAPINRLQELGLEIDHIGHQDDSMIEFVANDWAIETMISNNIIYSILHDDEEKYYSERLKQPESAIKKTRGVHCLGKTTPKYNTPTVFSYGSMGGYLTYTEAFAKLDSLAAMYPNILKAKAPLDTFKTYEGRSIYWYKISDNPNVDENEPELMYNALHHAREAITLSQIIYYMSYLCENYATNAEVKYIVDHTEMYFVPIVNPDGYIYNETIQPNGGGLWRKNRKPLSSGDYGVDLNRNYATGWGFNNIGSSPLTSSEVYRGPSAASEPEVKAIQWFCNQHQFKVAQNTHGFGAYWIYPWGYLEKNSNDSSIYGAMASELNKFSYYKCGLDMQTVGYSTNGSANDWQYDSSAGHNKIFVGIPEVGDRADGFWPAQTRILPLCEEMNYFNLTSAKLLLSYAVTNYEGSRFLNAFNTKIEYSINKIGLAPSAVYTVSILPLTANIASVGAPKIYNSLSLGNKYFDNISINIQTGTANNSTVKFVIECDNGVEKKRDTIDAIFGNAQIVFIDSCDNMSNWTGSNSWGIGAPGYNSNHALMDSPNGLYNAGAIETIVSKSISLQNILSAELRFSAKWTLQNNADIVNIFIVENGVSNLLCTKYTQPYLDAFTGTLGTIEAYNGIKDSWVNESINLDSYIGKTIQIAFELSTDFSLEFDGIAIDNVTVNGISTIPLGTDNTAPQVVNFYPNPINGIVYFTEAIEGIQLFSMDGQLVFSEFTHQSQFNLSTLPKGLYTTRICNANGLITNTKLQLD